MTLRLRVRDWTRLPLVRSTAALVLNTGINGALGLAYWVVAARLYDPIVVGLGAAGVSGLLFVASLGWIGLQQTFLRYLPVAGSHALRLILGVYGTAIAVALVAATVFLWYASGDPELSYLAAGPAEILGFLGAVLLWVIFSLQDPALIGLRRSHWVPLENLAFGLAKLGLLVGFVGLAGPWAILGSWVLGAGWLVIVVNLALRRTLHRRGGPARLPDIRRIVGFSLGQHAIAVVTAAPDSLAPLIVLGFLGGEATAYYYAAWTVSFSLRLLTVNLGSALTVEGAHARDGADARDGGDIRDAEDGTHGRPSGRSLSSSGRRLAALVVAPAVAVAWLAAPLVMAIYGPRYESAATDVLRLLIVGVVPFTAVTLFVVGERIAERTAAALILVGLATLVTIVLNVVLLPQLGLVAAGWAWVAGQSVAFAASLVVVRWRARHPA